MDYPIDPNEDKNRKLLSLCMKAGATRYLSGPSARQYFDHDLFKAAGIEVFFADYSGYPEYNQFFGGFIHEVSVLDLVFHTGPRAVAYMKRLL
jgi:hypothetical protein